jgi:uncharacterized membrane protein (GlpM family)
MHTVVLEYAALNIAGLDLASSTAIEQLRLLGTFGISNWITGALFILIALKAKHLSLYVMGLIPVAYGLSMLAISANTSGYATTTAEWGGMALMVPYLIFSGGIFIAGATVMIRARKK